MTSKSIYQEITPTYLYIKQHSITGLKYFGKTTRDPYSYSGSGRYWKLHYKKHGKEHIKTLWVSDLYYDTSIVEPALQFSYENNIVESDDWANLILENGLDGCKHTLDIIQKVKDTKIKNGTMNTTTPETIQKAKDTRERNGTEASNPLIKQKVKDTKIKNGTISSISSESIQKMLATKIKNGTKPSMENPETVQKVKDTKIARGVINPSKIPFLSLIVSKKSYAKNVISRCFPEFKQFY